MKNRLAVGVLHCPIALTHDESGRKQRVMLLPWGQIELRDGSKLLVDGEGCRSVVGEFDRHGVDIPFDKNHSTVYKLPAGEESPAFGWGKALIAQEGAGLFCDVAWTEEGLSEIRSGRYRYLSPVVGYDPDTGRVLAVSSVALTTKPATPHMPALAATEVFSYLTEKKIMNGIMQRFLAENDGNVATAEQKVGELKASLEARGVKLDDASDFVKILDAAIQFVKTGKAETKDDEDAQVAATVRTRLGLSPTASRDEVVIALATTGANAELASMRLNEKMRVARSMVDGYVNEGKILENDSGAMEAALSLATNDPARLKALMDNAVPIVPQGRIEGPTARQNVISKAEREYQLDDGLQKTTGVAAVINMALTDAGLATMSDDEGRAYRIA